MKKTFSFLVIFLISLLSLFGGYGLVNGNFKINNGDTQLANETRTSTWYPTIDSYLEKGDSASLEGWNNTVKIYSVLVTFNDFEIKEDEIYYYFTISVTSFYYNDLVGDLYLYNADDNSKIGNPIQMFEGQIIDKNETKSTDITFSVPIKTQVRIKFRFGSKGNQSFSVYTSTSVYPVIDDDLEPKIDSFDIEDSKTTTNTINVNWNIIDSYSVVNSVEIWLLNDNKSVVLKEFKFNSTMLVANNYVIDGLDSNTSYNLELRINWTNSISANGEANIVKQSILINTNAQVPTINDFSLVEITSDGVILSIKYDDPDKVVNSITISDENCNMEDITISPDDIVNDTYEIDIPQNGDYKLNITLNWTSLDGNGVVQANQQNQVVEFTFSNHAEEYNYNLYYILIAIFMILTIWIIIMILVKNRILPKN